MPIDWSKRLKPAPVEENPYAGIDRSVAPPLNYRAAKHDHALLCIDGPDDVVGWKFTYYDHATGFEESKFYHHGLSWYVKPTRQGEVWIEDSVGVQDVLIRGTIFEANKSYNICVKKKA